MAGVFIEIREPWAEGETIFLIGPGGVGKSTLGRELADRLRWPLVDLDLEFCERLEVIGPYIAKYGYARYRAANLELAQRLAMEAPGPMVFVASSGFLAGRAGSEDYASSRQLAGSGYGIVLLPSLELEVATGIVVERQLRRGFGLERDSEERKFRERFGIYRDAGKMLAVSVDPPGVIADTVVASLRAAV